MEGFFDKTVGYNICTLHKCEIIANGNLSLKGVRFHSL